MAETDSWEEIIGSSEQATSTVVGEIRQSVEIYNDTTTQQEIVTQQWVDEAIRLSKLGFSVIPLQPTKVPLVKWKQYQTERADEATIRQWAHAFPQCQTFGFVCGSVSGNILYIDFDVERKYNEFRAKCGELKGVVIGKSGRVNGGWQVILRHDGKKAYTSMKLAWIADSTQESGKTIGIETKGENGICVVAPSLHKSGNYYKIIEGDFANLTTLTTEQVDSLLTIALSLNEVEEVKPAKSAVEIKYRPANADANAVGETVISKYNTVHSIAEMLEGIGYQRCGDRMVRPGGDRPLTYIDEATNRSFHHSSDDPFSNGYWHRPFDIFVKHYHNGDVTAAVRAAAVELGMDHRPAEIEVWEFETDSNEGNAEPEPQSPTEWKPFPTHLLPRPIAAFCEAEARAKSTNVEAIILPSLSAIASAIGTSHKIRIKEGWEEYPTIWTCVLAKTGKIKSPCLSVATKANHAKNKESLDAYKEAYTKFEDAEEQYSIMKLRRVANLPSKPQPPKLIQHVVDDTTIEALAIILQEQKHGVLLVKDELSAWFNSFNMYRGGKGSDTQHWLSIFSSSSIIINRKSEPKVVKVEHPLVSVAGMVQPSVFVNLMSTEMQDNGMAARFLCAQPPDKDNLYTDYVTPQEVRDEYYGLIGSLYGADGTTVVSGTNGTREIWRNYHNTTAIESGTLPATLAAIWSKSLSYAARLTLLIHVVREYLGECGSEFDEVDVKAGTEIATWFREEARRIYVSGEAYSTPDIVRLRKVLEYMHQAKEKGITELSLRDLRKNCWMLSKMPDFATAFIANVGEVLGALTVKKVDTKGRPTYLVSLTGNTPDYTKYATLFGGF